MDPTVTAKGVFIESCRSLMAHSIRGVANHFYHAGLLLDLSIHADDHRAIPYRNSTSILLTRLFKVQINEQSAVNLIRAKIYIHKDATKNLARVCVAHELYHLLLELEAFKGTGLWRPLTMDRNIEESCEMFARHLCKFHDNFNRDAQIREDHVYFPGALFETVLKTGNIDNQKEWPLTVGLDSKKPFWQKPNFHWLN
jgi:hypothetical protein